MSLRMDDAAMATLLRASRTTQDYTVLQREAGRSQVPTFGAWRAFQAARQAEEREGKCIHCLALTPFFSRNPITLRSLAKVRSETVRWTGRTGASGYTENLELRVEEVKRVIPVSMRGSGCPTCYYLCLTSHTQVENARGVLVDLYGLDVTQAILAMPRPDSRDRQDSQDSRGASGIAAASDAIRCDAEPWTR